MRWIFGVSVAAALLGISCGDRYPTVDAYGTVSGHIQFGSKGTLAVRIAQTQEERQKGLMGVTSLPPDEGMAFMFRGPTTASFWMKGTLIPLSVAFVSHDRIVTVLEMEPCRADPCPTYGAGRPYAYAIEANAGWFEQHGIHAGDEVTSFDGPFFS
ncbi:MAG: DUF192 domain-containing protein [Actinobacteria bacterium]|nr:DUF192 domain-containing protein [Actinomycetota bacterium]